MQNLMTSNCQSQSLVSSTIQQTAGVLTDDKVQSEDPLALGLPSGHFNIHFVDIFLVGQLLLLALGRLARLSALQDGGSLFPYLPAALLQSVPSLCLDDPLLGQRNDVPGARLERVDSQHGEFEEEHEHHGGAGLLHHGVEGVHEHRRVVDEAEDQGQAQPGMEQPGVGGGLLFEHLDTTLADPSPDLARDERREHDQEKGANLLPEYSHGEAGFGDGKPGPLVELLNFDGSEGSVEESLQAVHKGSIDDEDEVDKDH